MHSVSRPLLSAIALTALVLVACRGGGDKKPDQGQTGSVSGLPTATAAVSTTETPSAVAGATETPPGLSPPTIGVLLERLMVPKVKIDSPVEVKGINGRGEMEDPSGKDAVAWYDFSEFPGFGGNAVFSAHVDWFTGELGPFGRLKELKDGDEIVLKLSNGSEMKYLVTATTLYESAKAPVAEIVAKTEKDSITFITCEGTFDRRAQDYSHRRIVRAERVS
jgi:LPXTG-site transpeptidase (sortase) family protein